MVLHHDAHVRLDWTMSYEEIAFITFDALYFDNFVLL